MSQNLFPLTVSAHCLSVKHCDFTFYVYSFIKTVMFIQLFCNISNHFLAPENSETNNTICLKNGVVSYASAVHTCSHLYIKGTFANLCRWNSILPSNLCFGIGWSLSKHSTVMTTVLAALVTLGEILNKIIAKFWSFNEQSISLQ